MFSTGSIRLEKAAQRAGQVLAQPMAQLVRHPTVAAAPAVGRRPPLERRLAQSV
jgi:hypothetical protein